MVVAIYARGYCHFDRCGDQLSALTWNGMVNTALDSGLCSVFRIIKDRNCIQFINILCGVYVSETPCSSTFSG